MALFETVFSRIGTLSAGSRQYDRALWSGLLVTAIPLALTLWFLRFVAPVAGGTTFAVAYPWVPSLGITLSFYLDGLSLLFALLVSGIGTLVMLYASSYLAGNPQLARFYVYMLAFMGSMLGLVLADNLLTMFIFWELTSITSYLLIGFKHAKEASRAAALQALLVTGGGGLALLAGLILLGLMSGSWELTALAGAGGVIQAHPLYAPMLLLILAGAFTKSAQVPFHFWLPNAMAAPTPVSAYLHSATMVKAGIYLLARLSPALAGTALWTGLVTTVGTATMLVGAYLAWQQTDLKRILAYSTVSALGTLTLLLGIGTPLAAKAAVVFLVVHSLYKGALFLVAGSVDHEAGSRDVTQLAGLRRAMPVTAVAGGLAALSMAGLPPLFGFIGKELLYEVALELSTGAWLLAGSMVVANALTLVAAGLVAVRPFWGNSVRAPNAVDSAVHEAPLRMLIGPALLAGLGLLAGLTSASAGALFVAPAVGAVAGQTTSVKLSLWHGINPMLVLSVVTVALGAGAYVWRAPLARIVRPLTDIGRMGPARGYDVALEELRAVAAGQTRLLQNGYLRGYIFIILATTVVLVGVPLVRSVGLTLPAGTLDVRLHEFAIAALILAATAMAVTVRSRLAAVAALGVVGYGVALLFVFFSAPDLAMTQFAIETLTVMLFVFVLYRLPRFARLSSAPARVRDAAIALTAGGLMSALVLAVTATSRSSYLASYFAENSLPLAKGRNIVNVILVDFRSLDTLAEITVLAVAAIGVYALLNLRLENDS